MYKVFHDAKAPIPLLPATDRVGSLAALWIIQVPSISLYVWPGQQRFWQLTYARKVPPLTRLFIYGSRYIQASRDEVTSLSLTMLEQHIWQMAARGRRFYPSQ